MGRKSMDVEQEVTSFEAAVCAHQAATADGYRFRQIAPARDAWRAADALRRHFTATGDLREAGIWERRMWAWEQQLNAASLKTWLDAPYRQSEQDVRTADPLPPRHEGRLWDDAVERLGHLLHVSRHQRAFQQQ